MIYDNNDNLIKDIENSEKLIEMETIDNDPELDTIEKLKEKINELQIPINTNDYFVKKAEIELKKILNEYHTYIQKVNNTFDLKGYQLVVIDTFDDMLEIRETLSQPILMVENKEKTGTYFIIPSTTKLLYTYTLIVDKNKKKDILKKKVLK